VVRFNPPSFGDNLKGTWRSLISGTGMRPGMTWRHVRNAQAEREQKQAFGTGEVGGDRSWTQPVHATTQDGRPVTISFGKGSREGQTLVCDGHVNRDTFYQLAKDGKKGHDHYLVDGRPAGRHGIRERYKE
jgi:hypothetical protein